MRNIESIVRERRNSAQDFQGRRPSSTEAHLIARRAELWEILRILDVHDCQFTMPTPSKLFQGPDDAHAVSKIEHVQRPLDVGTAAAVPVVVCRFFYLCTPFPLTTAQYRLRQCFILAISDSRLRWCERDRRPSGSSPLAPVQELPPIEDPDLIEDAGPRLSATVSSLVLDQALERLVARAVPHDELAPLVEEIFSRKNAIDMVDCLQGCDAQSFVDVMDEVRHHALPPSRNGFADF